MNLDQVLQREVTALLENPSPIPTAPSTPQKLKISFGTDNEHEGSSIFARAWNILHQSPLLTLSRSVSSSKNNSNEVRETGDDPNNNKTDDTSSTMNTAGPPSITDSLNKMNGLLGAKMRPSVPRLLLNNNNNPKLSSTHSKILVRDSKTIQRKPSDGINAILDCSSTSVGSTHRSSMTFRGPKCAYDYIKMVQNAEGNKVDDIPMTHFSYEKMDEEKDFSEAVPTNKESSYNTPILTEKTITTKTINKSFLETVNEQIQHIKANQARDRSILCATLNNNNGEAGISGDSSTNRFPVIIEQSIDRPQEILSIGTSKHTTIIDDNIRNKIRTESSIQTETGINSPVTWGLRSRIDSQMTMLSNRPRKFDCIDWSIPLSPDTSDFKADDSYCHQREILRREKRVQRSSSFFGNFLNFNGTFGITSYSLQAAWNTADEIFRNYVISLEPSENQVTNEEMEAVEDVVAVSVMRLLGLPMQTRYAIYDEVLQEIQVVHDFSVGTIQLISNVIDWICTGNHEGTEDLISKTRLLVTTQTEVDPDSDTWIHFERDMCVFSEAVTKAVESAARVMSRHCIESCESLARKIPAMMTADKNNNNNKGENQPNLENTSSSTYTPEENFGSTTQSTPNGTSIEDEEAPVNIDVIGQMVTDSEFELPPVTSIPRTESQSSSNQQSLLRRKKSRIPIPVSSSTSSNAPRQSWPREEEENQIEKDMSISMLREAMRNEEGERGRRNFGQEIDDSDDTQVDGNDGSDSNRQDCSMDDADEQPQSFNEDEEEGAWQFFDHTKHQESRLAMSNPSGSVSQLSVQSTGETTAPESKLEVQQEESMTARLSKAALRGLYNTLKDAIPSPLITMSYNNVRKESQPQQSSSSSISEIERIDDTDSWSGENFSPQENEFQPEVTGSRILTSPSGHRYLVNSRHSSIHENVNSEPSTVQMRVPTNSDAQFNRQLADARMCEDIAYLEEVLKTLKESSNLAPSNQQQSNSRLVAGQQQQPQQNQNKDQQATTTLRPRAEHRQLMKQPSGGKTSAVTISPTKKLIVPIQNTGVNSLSKLRKNDFDGSATSVSAPPRPRIVRQSFLNRTIPVKPKLQIITAVVPSGSNSSTSSPRPTMIHFQSSPESSQYVAKPTISKNVDGGVTSHSRPANISNNKAAGSYLHRNEMLKKNQSTVGNGRSRTTYSSNYLSKPPENNNSGQTKSIGRPISKGGVKHVDSSSMSSSQRPVKPKVSAYKYGDGTHDPANSGSGQCSSSCSTGHHSHTPSVNPVITTNDTSDSSRPNTGGRNSVIKNNPPPLFFPSLDSPRRFTNPFAR